MSKGLSEDDISPPTLTETEGRHRTEPYRSLPALSKDAIDHGRPVKRFKKINPAQKDPNQEQRWTWSIVVEGSVDPFTLPGLQKRFNIPRRKSH